VKEANMKEGKAGGPEMGMMKGMMEGMGDMPNM
jgi:hypothetical protein